MSVGQTEHEYGISTVLVGIRSCREDGQPKGVMMMLTSCMAGWFSFMMYPNTPATMRVVLECQTVGARAVRYSDEVEGSTFFEIMIRKCGKLILPRYREKARSEARSQRQRHYRRFNVLSQNAMDLLL